MKVYRIARSKYIKDLTGTGARLYGGRWNPKGVAVLYASENKSLAALEVLVHLNSGTVPDDLQIATLEIPDEGVAGYDREKFKAIKRNIGAIRIFQEEGKEWITSGSSLALIVPSILIPGENNILLNPAHALFEKVEIILIEDFLFDQRLFEFK